MSALTIHVYAKASAESQLKRLKKFATLLAETDYDAIEAMDEEEVLYDVEELVLLKSHTLPDRLFYLQLDGPTSFEVDGLSAFLQNQGAEEVEIAAFSSQVGEYFFQKNDETFDRFDETQWTYLTDPDQAFFEHTVVVTGVFADHDREAIEALVLANGGKVQQAVNAKTTTLIVGDKPGGAKLAKADELGVPRMDAAEFWQRLKDAEELKAGRSD